MGLPLSLLYLLRPALAELRRAARPVRALGLGYPDVVAGADELGALFGEALSGPLPLRAGGREIRRRHGFPDGEVVETRALFAALGVALECIDVQPESGVDRVVDLNRPLPAELVGRYGLVLDPGTIEHCFNIGQAMMNAAQAVALGGYIAHVSPLSMFNHGFYNLNPTFYHDFYGDNGFQLQFMNGLAAQQGAGAFFDVTPVLRFSGVPDNSVLLVIARRVAERVLRWPVQSKYRGAAGTAA